MECGLRAPAGCSVGPCGLLCVMWAWGSALGDHNVEHDQALLGWGPRVACCVSAFRGASWASADRALWSPFFTRLVFGSQEYYVYSLETNTIFLTHLQNLEHL